MNFQMNRLYGSVGEPDMLEEMRMAFRQFETADVSASITQDVLLLAGSEDHYIRIEQWYAQTRMLTNARSMTARLFTLGESAQNHCQVGNQGLALKTIVNWLDGMQLEKAQLLNG